MNFDFETTERKEALDSLIQKLDDIYENSEQLAMGREKSSICEKAVASIYDFNSENKLGDVLDTVVTNLKRNRVQVLHPAYMGLFNPRPNFPSILADLISAYLNPQLAVRSHAPYAHEVERFVMEQFSRKIGYDPVHADGTFCSGGAESNLTALLCGLQDKVPGFTTDGLNGTSRNCTVYCSSQSHHSIQKAAKCAGLGVASVRAIRVDSNFEIDLSALEAQLERDLENGCLPVMVVGTAGTTGVGAIDDLSGVAALARRYNLWFHVDAAYGAAALTTDLRTHFRGIKDSDSVTMDLHKWFSVPMGTSLFLTGHGDILSRTFSTSTDYMPVEDRNHNFRDPYVNSIQWSRRFIGLKIYIPLAVFGWKGYGEVIETHIQTGNFLRKLLHENGWTVRNNSLLPIVCFGDDFLNNDQIQQLVDEIIDDGVAWISTFPINDKLTIRACITNYNTYREHVLSFVKSVSVLRDAYLNR